MAEFSKVGGIDRITVPTVDEHSRQMRLRVGSKRRAAFTDHGLTVAGATELFEALGIWLLTGSPEDGKADRADRPWPESLPGTGPAIELASRQYAYLRVQDMVAADPDISAHTILGMLMGEFQVAGRTYGVGDGVPPR